MYMITWYRKLWKVELVEEWYAEKPESPESNQGDHYLENLLEDPLCQYGSFSLSRIFWTSCFHWWNPRGLDESPLWASSLRARKSKCVINNLSVWNSNLSRMINSAILESIRRLVAQKSLNVWNIEIQYQNNLGHLQSLWVKVAASLRHLGQLGDIAFPRNTAFFGCDKFDGQTVEWVFVWGIRRPMEWLPRLQTIDHHLWDLGTTPSLSTSRLKLSTIGSCQNRTEVTYKSLFVWLYRCHLLGTW